MPNIVRPPKTAGTNTYQTEVAANAIAILDTEVDQDFDTVYRAVNGNIDDDNINFSGLLKRIQKSKLNLDGAIGPGDLAPGAIDGGGPIIKDQSITAQKIGIGQTTIALGHLVDETAFNVGTTEQLLAEVVMTPVRAGGALRGGYFLTMGRISGQLSGNVIENVTITISLKMDGAAGDTSGSLLERSISQVQFNASPGLSWAIPFNLTLIAPRVLSTTGRFKLTGQTTTPQAVGFGFAVHTRSIHGWELA